MINVNKKMNEKKQSYNFEAYIPPITDEEFASLNKEDDFQEINPADLYNKK